LRFLRVRAKLRAGTIGAHMAAANDSIDAQQQAKA
jgi:hypothetical protein